MNHGPSAGHDVTVVIPCRDEEHALPALLRSFPTSLHPLVVDNGSRDNTASVARSLGCTVVHQPVPGYGAAVHAGVVAADTPIVCTIDGDGSMDPTDLPRLVQALHHGADLAVGRRRPLDRTSWSMHSRLGTELVARQLRNRHGVNVHDIGPMRALRRDDLLRLGIGDRRFGYPVELLARAGAAGWSIVELDVAYRSRTAGKSKVSGSMKGSLLATRDFLAVLREMETHIAY